MTQAALTLENVYKTYGDFTAVKDISLSIPKGLIYGFLGPNGAGKTTTLRMVLDIIKPSQGKITVLGSPSAMQVRQRIGYLPEEKGLYKKMKVSAIIAYFAMLKGMTPQLARMKALSLLEQYGLGEYAESKVEALSKGMGQKVQVLSAIAHEPELVILDEPFSGLDPVNQQVLEKMIRSMADNGQTVIFSTHIMEHAERLCDRILLIAKGTKIFDGSVQEAKALIPRRLILESREDLRQLLASYPQEQINQLSANTDTDPRWQILLSDQTDPQDILKHCFATGISLSRFEFSEPSLHDVFVHLIGDEAREHRHR